MNLQDTQAKKYIEEANLTLDSARAIFNEAKRGKPLWAQVVKLCYDSMEQAISAAIAKRGELIPKEHPEKVTKFIALYGEQRISKLILRWLGKRGRAQYVDIRGGRIVVPHELFNEEDAKLALEDATEIISDIKNLISK